MKKNYTIDNVFALVLFCFFTVAVIFVLMSGALAYKNISQNTVVSYEDRTCLAYINAKIRHYDALDRVVSTGAVDKTSVLTLEENIGEEKYVTLIYLYEGMVKELFVQKDSEFSLDQGLDVVEAESLAFTQVNQGLIKVVCGSTSGEVSETFISIKSGKEVAF